MKFAVFGATGQTGIYVCSAASQLIWFVRAFINLQQTNNKKR